MRLVKGTFDNGQLLLDELVETTKPVRVVVVFEEETLPKGRPDFSNWPKLSLGDDSGTTYSREEMYGDDMR
jgi:hypothetical protein